MKTVLEAENMFGNELEIRLGVKSEELYKRIDARIAQIKKQIEVNRQLMKEAAKKLEFILADQYKREAIRLEELLEKKQ